MSASLLLFAQACGSGDDSGEANSGEVNEVIETETHVPELSESPVIVEWPLSGAESAYDIQVDAVDIGPLIMDHVEGEREILDRDTWSIIAYCPAMEDGTVKAGVIEENEYFAMVIVGQDDGIAENQYAELLDCPEWENGNGADGNASI